LNPTRGIVGVPTIIKRQLAPVPLKAKRTRADRSLREWWGGRIGLTANQSLKFYGNTGVRMKDIGDPLSRVATFEDFKGCDYGVVCPSLSDKSKISTPR
jgi:hypothetical protein